MSAPAENPLLEEAMASERRCDWDSAASHYRDALGSAGPGPRSGELRLRLGRSLELAANQAWEGAAVRERLSEAIAVYGEMETGSGSFPSQALQEARAHRLRLESLLAPDVRRRRSLLDEALEVQRVVLVSTMDRSLELLRATNFHLLLLRERYFLDSGESGAALVREGLESSLRLEESQVRPSDEDEGGDALAYRLFFGAQAAVVLRDWSDKEGRGPRLLDAALKLVPNLRHARTTAFLHIQIADSITQGIGKSEAELKQEIERALQASRATRDRSLVGQALAQAIDMVRWQLAAEKDPDAAKGLFEEINALFEEAKSNLEGLPDVASEHILPFVYADLALGYDLYATNFVLDRVSRLRLLEKDVAFFERGSELAGRVGGFSVAYLGATGVKALRQLAALELNPGRKKELLRRAVATSDTSVETISRVMPFDLQNIDSMVVVGALARAELADQIDDEREMTEMLLSAMDGFRRGLSGLKAHASWSHPGQSLRIGENVLRFTGVSGKLFRLTGDRRYQVEQIESLGEAERAFSRGGLPSRAAEALWKKAEIQSAVGSHAAASVEFRRSAELYRSAADANPSLEELYADLSLYMKAWSEVETARARHTDGSYSSASEAYRQTSATLRSTQRWSPLAEHYVACSKLEEAEALSHDEDPESSSRSFGQAADLFDSFSKKTADWTPTVSGTDELGESLRWKAITSQRKTYCRARADLERAKLLDRRGDHQAAAEQFAMAASVLEGMLQGDDTDEKKEVSALALSCRAWQTMQEAEATHSSERYAEAAKLFEKAAQTTANSKVGLAARGNLAYCNALVSGTGLRSTREADLYPKTKMYLEAAADYYTEAGMERTSKWTRATERVFDGLVYLARAEKEVDPRQKRESYVLAERSFEAASRFFGEADYPGKKEQADRYLRSAKEQKLAFLPPTEAFEGSVVLQQSGGQVPPELTSDKPFGVDRFEGSNVQAKILADRSEVTVGESSDLLLEMVSAGRVPAMLVKVADLTSVGLKVETVAEKFRVEEGAVALNGQRLDPFETFDLHLRITPQTDGDFELRPRVLYLDQEGRYRENQLPPVRLRGKIGRTVARATSIPELEASSSAVFEYLVRAFVDDYMTRKLQLEQAGWRSIPQVAQNTRISRSVLYGTPSKYGRGITDLLSRGLIETRISTGHRGRGGDATKLRIAYDKEPVKRYVDRVAIGSK